MPKLYLFIILISLSLLISGCSKKHHPGKTLENNSTNIKSSDSVSTKKTTLKRKEPTPKVIVVNDNVARKSVDGRLYYDLMGHRYWKNYKDGKYYLFSQSMYNDDSFKPK